jgi:anti-anti-sigma factor
VDREWIYSPAATQSGQICQPGRRFYALERDHSDSEICVVGLIYSGSEAVITLAGELDLASGPVLHELLLEAGSAGAETIRIDVHRLTYSDSAGLGVPVSAHKRLQSNDGSLVISGPTPRVMRVLATSGLTRYFTIRT